MKERSEDILKLMLSDTVNARIQHNDTSYTLIDRRGKRRINSQIEFSRIAKKALKEAKKKLLPEKLVRQDLQTENKISEDDIYEKSWISYKRR